MTKSSGSVFTEVTDNKDDLVSLDKNKGTLTITKSKATDTSKSYYIGTAPGGKSFNSYPKLEIKIQAVCGNEELKAKATTALTETYKSENGSTTKDLDFTTVEGWFEITHKSGGTVSDKCKVESYSLVEKDGTAYKELTELDGHPGYKVASPSEILVSDKKALQIHLDHKVDNYKFYVQAKMTGGKTAVTELDITVPAFECDATKSIALANSDTEEYSIGSSDDDKVIKKVDVIKALFKIETEKKTKVESCAEL